MMYVIFSSAHRVCCLPALFKLGHSTKMAMAQQTVQRRRHPMLVRRRRHTFTSCTYVTLSISAQNYRREACDNDSPRGGPVAGSPNACYTLGWGIRPDRRYDIMAPPVH